MFWNNFVILCNKIGKSPNGVCADLGYSTAIATKWKNGAVPRDTTLKKIADYFGVSVDYLQGKEKASDVKSNASFLDTNGVHMIPVYESASAGFGTMADNYIIEYMPLYVPNAHEAAETLCIKVQGDSMSPRIENGDVIQVHKQTSVDSGDLAVVLVDGEDAFVKKVIYGDSFIELHSFNSAYKTVRFDGAEVMRVQIIGLVRKIIKNADRASEALPEKTTTDERLSSLVDKLTDDELRELELLVDYIISKRKNNRPE